jgi:hypothetical protein
MKRGLVQRDFVARLVRAVLSEQRILQKFDAQLARDLKQACRAIRDADRDEKKREDDETRQLKLCFQDRKRGKQNWTVFNRRTRRKCKYHFQMVNDARAMRANGYEYKEIAAALEREHGIRVPWITVRDWVQCYYRLRG